MNRDTARRVGFWILALSWLPTAVIAQIVRYDWLRSGPFDWVTVLWSQAPLFGFASNPDISTLQFFWPVLAIAVIVFAYISVLPALLCRQIWRLGYRRSAWAAGTAIAFATVAVLGGVSDGFEEFNFDLMGSMIFLPIWTAVYMALFSLLLWVGLVSITRRK